MFHLPDITYANPLFPAVMGAKFRIKTDGERVAAKLLFITNPVARHIKRELGGNRSVSQIKDWFILMGHLWCPSVIVKKQDLELRPYVPTATGK